MSIKNPRVPQYHIGTGKALTIPVKDPVSVFSICPVTLPASDRMLDLQMRISGPATAERKLPVVLLSHGLGHSNYLSSMYGYGPLVHFLASQGFVVIQPTHLDSTMLGVDLRSPDAPQIWESMVDDMTKILDNLDTIEAVVPQLTGRLDRDNIAVIGHSMGGLTAEMLLGLKLELPDGRIADLKDPRIKAGVLLAAPGSGKDMTPQAYQQFPFSRNPIFSDITKPVLVICGDADSISPWTTRGADWHADAYSLSPSPKSLVTVTAGGHSLGGISGYDAAEATDENVELAAVVERLTWAYLQSAFYSDDPAWPQAYKAFEQLSELGHIENK